MSYPANENDQRAHVASVVRGNVWSVAIGAALLCYFGFFSNLLEPEGTTLFERSNWIFFHTIRIGGPCLALITIWSLVGMRAALAADGVVSITIGVLFILSGGGMLIGGGDVFSQGLYVLFGMMFFGSGRRNWQTYRHLVAGGRVIEADTETLPKPARPATPVAHSAEPGSVVETPVSSADAAPAPADASTAGTAPVDVGEVETPAEGFLAAMAKKPPPSEP